MNSLTPYIKNPVALFAGATILCGAYILAKRFFSQKTAKVAQTTFQANESTYVIISQSDLSNSRTLNQKLVVGCKMGFFYLEMPPKCKALIGHAVKAANAFHKDPKIKTQKFEGFSGYHDRKNFQIESLYLEQRLWSTQLSPELSQLAAAMKTVAIDLLKKTLKFCGIPREEWAKASGKVTIDKGQIHFTYNHYRADKSQEGLSAHKDFGQITVLFIDKKGLQAKIAGQWAEVLPIKDHFVVNYGRALETYVNDPSKLTAAWHRVPQLTEDRISIGIFADNSNDSTIYLRENGVPKSTRQSYEAYLKNSFATSYEEDSKK